MLKQSLFTLVLIGLLSCNQEAKQSIPPSNIGSKEIVSLPQDSSLVNGTTYLAVYSEIYNQKEHLSYDLTATVSLRNTSISESIYISKADYYNTAGELIKEYLNGPISLKPLETAEIVILQNDKSGGSGANFIIDWSTCSTCSEPLFESVMISTQSQLGLSFTSQGKRIK